MLHNLMSIQNIKQSVLVALSEGEINELKDQLLCFSVLFKLGICLEELTGRNYLKANGSLG